MRRRVKPGFKVGLSATTMLIASGAFLGVSLLFSVYSWHVAHGQSLEDTLNKSVGVAQAEALSATTPADTTIATIPATLPQVPDNSSVLTQQLTEWVGRQPKSQQWAITVRSLDDELLRAGVNGDQQFGSASIFKLYLTYGLTKFVPYDQWDKKAIDGDRTYADCVQLMMSRSDNPCAVAIGTKLGWGKVSDLLAPAGYAHTTLKSETTPTTANDTTQIMTDIYGRHNFSNEVSSLILDAMSKSVFRKGIVAGCPDCQVANKTGDINGALHDTAIITINNKHYVLTVMSQGGSQRQIASAAQLVHDFIVDN